MSCSRVSVTEVSVHEMKTEEKKIFKKYILGLTCNFVCFVLFCLSTVTNIMSLSIMIIITAISFIQLKNRVV